MRARGWPLSTLERRAGMSQGQLATAFKRMRDKPDNDGLKLETVRRLSDALQVSFEWLANGSGEMDASVRPVSHQRRQAIQLARGRSVPEHVLDACEQEPDTDPPRTVAQWRELILELVTEDRALERALSTPTPPPASVAEPQRQHAVNSDSDQPPPPAPRGAGKRR